MSLEYFGTDGIRGSVGGNVVNPRFASRLGVAAGKWAKDKRLENPLVLIGRDTRPSGIELLRNLAKGFGSENLEVVSLGVIPTPALALAVPRERACLGVMITASHNPSSDNGFKFFNQLGHKISPVDELLIEKSLPGKAPHRNAKFTESETSFSEYLQHLGKVMKGNVLDGWVIALDTANGATSKSTRIVLEQLGAKVEQIGEASENQLINDGVGSEHPDRLAALTLEKKARLGIAHDGDGDRVVFCDEEGVVVEGDCILGILALDAHDRDCTGSGSLVTTVYANHGLDKSMKEHGIEVQRTEVGDRCVAERMREINAAVGGEPSGHLILQEFSSAGDGPMAALNVVRIMLEQKRPLSELKKCVTLMPSLSGAFAIAEKKPLDELDKLGEKLSWWANCLAEHGRVFVRYSGTERKIRLLVEAKEETIARDAFSDLEDTLRKELKFL